MTLRGRVNRSRRTWFVSLAALALVTGLCVARGALPAFACDRQDDGWHLDTEQAMDAIGLAPGMIVGEAGAGDGYFTLPMARRVGPRGAVYANDISERALRSLDRRAASEGLSNIHTVVGEIADPRFPRRDLQLVVVVHAFHDFRRPVEWLVHLKAYLRPGATVAIIDKDPDQGAESHFWTRRRIEQYATEAGYHLTRATESISAHLVLVFTPGVTS